MSHAMDRTIHRTMDQAANTVRELTVVEAPAPAPARIHFSQEQRDLIKRTVVPTELTDEEFAVFILIAERRGLDPLENQITAVKRYDSRLKRDRMTAQTTIDGSCAIAQDTGELAGIARPAWGPIITDASGHTHPEWAEATVFRRLPDGTNAPFIAVAWWDEFRQIDRQGALTKFWRDMPRQMLYKVALSHALRRAFQRQLAGIYTDDEMDQADNPPPARLQAAPAPVAPAAAPSVHPSARRTRTPAAEHEHDTVPTAPELRARLVATGDEGKLSLMWAKWWNETHGEVGRLLARVEKREAEYRGWVSRLRDRAFDAGMVRDEEGWADLVVSIVTRNDLTERPLSYAEWKRVEVEVETVAEQIRAERQAEGETETPDEHQLDELPIDGTEGRS